MPDGVEATKSMHEVFACFAVIGAVAGYFAFGKTLHGAAIGTVATAVFLYIVTRTIATGLASPDRASRSRTA
jgi:small-conductance mechanosensitive channel